MNTTVAGASGAAGAPPSATSRRRHRRTALWLLVCLAALPLPGPSWIVAGLVFLAGACALVAEHLVASTPVRLALATVMAACGVAAMVLVPVNGVGWVPIFVSVVSAARLITRRAVVMVFAVVVAGAFALTVAWLAQTPWAALSGIGVPLVALRVWDREALRREHDRVLALLAELEARRAGDRRAAAAEERARIARDLHDVLAHTLSGLSLHLQAVRAVVARTPAPDPTVVTALDRAADLARDGLGEARRAVAALREGPPPGRDDLVALVEAHPGASLATTGPFDLLAPGLRETAFATVRESLTNAGRYAPGSAVAVDVAVADGLTVSIDDHGPSVPLTADDQGGGNGLRGLVERASAAGGTLTATARGDGWRVVLRVPDATTGGAG